MLPSIIDSPEVLVRPSLRRWSTTRRQFSTMRVLHHVSYRISPVDRAATTATSSSTEAFTRRLMFKAKKAE